MIEWAAIFAIEDEDMEKAQKDGGNNKLSSKDNEDLTDALIAAIDQDREERGL